MAVSMAQNSWAALERTDKRDWRGAMGFLKERAAPGDVAVCMGSDTVPPAYRPKAYGKDRYGPSHLNFIPVSTDTPLDAFSSADWRPQSNSVWMLVYTDRMYTGVDRVVPPENPSQKSSRAANFSSRGLSGGVIGTVTFGQSHIHAIHSFNGLFLVELPQGRPAIDRLMDTIGEWYTILPAEASIPAPALLRWRYAISRGDAFMAAESLSAARKQCASKADLAALEKIVQSGEAVAKR